MSDTSSRSEQRRQAKAAAIGGGIGLLVPLAICIIVGAGIWSLIPLVMSAGLLVAVYMGAFDDED